MAWVLWKDGESKRLKQKRKPCFEITLSHIQTFWSKGTVLFPGRLPARSRRHS